MPVSEGPALASRAKRQQLSIEASPIGASKWVVGKHRLAQIDCDLKPPFGFGKFMMKLFCYNKPLE